MFDITQNYALCRKIAREGMILLKNDGDVLPLAPQRRVRLYGNELIAGGGGSAAVNCAYVRTLKEGLEGRVTLCEGGEELSIAILQRNAREGYDRALSPNEERRDTYAGETVDGALLADASADGTFTLSPEERSFFGGLSSDTVLILNLPDLIDLSFIEEFPRIKAVLLAYQPGMEAGTAVADLLCGAANPCGKLPDTIARRYEDYPSSANFNTEPFRSDYQEGVFLGYRHFETYAPEAVLYPFGFGLSYTTFALTDPALLREGETLTAALTVTNTGKVAGKEVIQVYSGAPKGALPRPKKELRGYQKTRLLAPGESQRVEINFPIASLAAFDETEGAYLLEAGDYPIYIGNSVRAVALCGTHTEPTRRITARATVRLDRPAAPIPYPAWTLSERKEQGYLLSDVAEGACTLQEFICQLSSAELIHLAMGQPATIPSGTAGVGDLFKRGVPNPQTADGSAGIRRSVHTTFFPCATLLAAAWDPSLLQKMGEALGTEGVSTGVDILLGPAMNLHRNPRCGRNFEYFSEDPLLSGRSAAALVRGMQSRGMMATLKHFAANNCELHRKQNDSVMTERTLRELYLKGFEIAVKEGDPAFIMSSYNLINGVHASADPRLLQGILRQEWGFRGATMTDWRNGVPLDEEVLAGNNIKMPFGYFDEQARLTAAYEQGKVPLSALRENAYWVLSAVLRTHRFAVKDFGPCHRLADRTEIPAIEVFGLSTTRTCQKEQEYLYRLHIDQRQQRSYLLYRLEAPTEATYTLQIALCTNEPKTQLWLDGEDGTRLATAYCTKCTDPQEWYVVETELTLPAGEQLLKVTVANEPDRDYPLQETRPNPKEDLFLKSLTFIRK